MAHENDRRRRLILSTIAEAGMRAHLYVASSAGRSQRAARDDCLRALIPDMTEIGVTRIVIESCDQDRHDRQTIVEALSKAGNAIDLSYVHLPPAGDPILWAADAIVWAWGRGGDWRRRTDDVVKVVRRCGH
jgi:hypothetical protein